MARPAVAPVRGGGLWLWAVQYQAHEGFTFVRLSRVVPQARLRRDALATAAVRPLAPSGCRSEFCASGLTDGDRVACAESARTRLMESAPLRGQAMANTAERFANASSLRDGLLNVTSVTMEAHGGMSRPALNREVIQAGLWAALLGLPRAIPGRLCGMPVHRPSAQTAGNLLLTAWRLLAESAPRLTTRGEGATGYKRSLAGLQPASMVSRGNQRARAKSGVAARTEARMAEEG